MESKHYVYVISNTANSKVYVGKCKDPSSRWRCHKSDARRKDTGCILLNRAIRKHGLEAFTFKVVAEFETEEQALAEERRRISDLRSNEPEFGYNIYEGGTGSRRLSIESRAKIGRASKARLSPEHHAAMVEAARLANTGRKYPERGKKISAALKGRKHSPEHVKKQADAVRGRKHSDEAKANMSAARRGKPHPWRLGKPLSEQTRKKISASQKGKPKPGVSLALKGRPKTPEHCAALSEGHRRAKEAREAAKNSQPPVKFEEERCPDSPN